MPLENRVDFLTLQTGQKIDFPFNVLVIFATNLNPAELLDEAFIRRIQYKVLAESPTLAEFLQIFEDCCVARGIETVPLSSRTWWIRTSGRDPSNSAAVSPATCSTS